MFDESLENENRLKVDGPELVEQPVSDRDPAALIFDLPEQFEILSVIGEGGMGTVFKCRNKYTERLVAIKVLHGKFDETSRRRFQQEARAASALVHENAVQVYDFGLTASGMPYLVMEYLDGRSLSSLLEAEPILSEQLVAEIFVGVCSALELAHQRGIIHRDIKPSNLVVLGDHKLASTVKVLDFGIAKILNDNDHQGVTKTGEVFGSPLYMSPEQCAGNNTDLRSDIYSVGASMYECLLGTPPHVGTNAMQTIFRRATEKPATFRQARPDLQISSELESIVMRSIAKDPAARYQNVHELKEDLSGYLLSVKRASDSSSSRDRNDSVDRGELAGKTVVGQNNGSIGTGGTSGTSGSGKTIVATSALVIAGIIAIAILFAGWTSVGKNGSSVEKTGVSSTVLATGAPRIDSSIEQLKEQALLALNQRRLSDAIKQYKDALSRAEIAKPVDNEILCDLHVRLAEVYELQHDWFPNESELKAALALNEDPHRMAMLKRLLGHNYVFSDQVGASIPVLEDAIKLDEKLSSYVESVFALNELSYAHFVRKQFRECLVDCTTELAAISHIQGGSLYYEGGAYQRRGDAYMRLGEYQRAIDDSRMAIAVLKGGDSQIGASTIEAARKTIAQATRALSERHQGD